MEGKDYEYVYYWYHHMMPPHDRLKIQNAIDSHDFDEFCKYYKKYETFGWENAKMYDEEGERFFGPICYFPSQISVWKDAEILDGIPVWEERNFKKITFSECECG